jgi:hypothetical protein
MHIQQQILTLSYCLVYNIKIDIPEDDIADVERCQVNSQPKCAIIEGI